MEKRHGRRLGRKNLRTGDAVDTWPDMARYGDNAGKKVGGRKGGAAAVWESKERKYKKFTILEGKSQSM